MVLRLWGGAMEPLGDLPPFLLQMDGLMSMESDSGSRLSRVVGLELTQLGGLYMENPSWRLIRVNSAFSPLYSSASILAKGWGFRTLPTAAGGVIFPIIVPHGKPSVLEWMNPPRYGSNHYLDY